MGQQSIVINERMFGAGDSLYGNPLSSTPVCDDLQVGSRVL